MLRDKQEGLEDALRKQKARTDYYRQLYNQEQARRTDVNKAIELLVHDIKHKIDPHHAIGQLIKANRGLL